MGKRSTAAILKAARRRRVPFSVLLVPDDLAQQYDAATEAVEAAKGTRKAAAAKATLIELNEQLGEYEISGTLEALPPLKWAALLGEHPPRDEVRMDLFNGFNSNTFGPEAIRESIVAWGDADGPTDEEWDDFIEVVSTGEIRRLRDEVVTLNSRVGGAIPKLPSDWLATPKRDSA